MRSGLYNLVRNDTRVAQMAVFEDGSAVVRWLTGKDSTVNWAKWQDAVDVHVNSHPDTTMLVPAGKRVEPERDLSQSDEWAALRQSTKRLSTAIYDWCADRQLRCEEHDSHGLYFDVWIGMRKFMFDCSPEDEPSSYQKQDPGRVVIRDNTHHYNKPTRVATVNFLTGKGLVELDNLLGTRPI